MEARFLILLPLAFIMASCLEGPKLSICVLDGKNQTLQCRKPNGDVFVLTTMGADNFMCLSPDDTEALLNYCKRK